MREIDIKIRPVGNISSFNEAVKFIKDMLSVIERIITSRSLIHEILEDLGSELLDRARANAERGYVGLPYDPSGVKWKQRSELVKALYLLSPFHKETAGLDAGQHKLIDSLVPRGVDNIFEITGKTIEVGTSFGKSSKGASIASLLEYGGLRDAGIYGAIGVDRDGNAFPWLKNAFPELQKRFGYNSIDDLIKDLTTPVWMESRPFLRPALWSLDNDKHHLELATEIIIVAFNLETRIEISGV